GISRLARFGARERGDALMAEARDAGFDWRDTAASLLLLLFVAGYVWAALDLCGRPEEDAAMLMRYSRHLAAGQGIVWNVGEKPVDGATDFLFMVALGGVHGLGLRRGACA